MQMATNLAGRVRNTQLCQGNGLFPLFEAVVNSIHAIEEKEESVHDGQITIEIVRDPQSSLDLVEEGKKPGRKPEDDITDFIITDNGVGFNDDNMASFQTLDSDHKNHKGAKGVGRLLWLKAFRHVSVESKFVDAEGKRKYRTFEFNKDHDIHEDKIEDSPDNVNRTQVRLSGFIKKYRENSPKTAKTISTNLLEHCLWYFIREGGAPRIKIKDGNDDITLDEVYKEYIAVSSVPEKISIKEKDFELMHVKLQINTKKQHGLVLCAANRVVEEENLKGKIPGLYGNIENEEKSFIYQCYVRSQYLDERVRPERTGFVIDEETLDLFKETEISLADIKTEVIAKAEEHLAEYLGENKRKSKERVEEFVSHKAPRYRPIFSRISENQLYVDPTITDKDLELHLHGELKKIEEELLAEGHDILVQKENEADPEYQERVNKYLEKTSDVKKTDLASYVCRRKAILAFLEEAIQKKDDGKYVREEIIHNLIMPMGKDSNGIKPDSANLWIIDERLTFHHYLASDISLSSIPITGSNERKEPDIISLNVFDNPVLVSEEKNPPLASIVVVEIKRPMRNDAAQGEDKDPIEQVLGYLDRVREGQVTTSSGRPIPNSENIAGYCYVICDLTPTMKNRCKKANLIHTYDGLGFFGYNQPYKAYIEVISFDQLVNAAKRRNRAFFDKLGLLAD